MRVIDNTSISNIYNGRNQVILKHSSLLLVLSILLVTEDLTRILVTERYDGSSLSCDYFCKMYYMSLLFPNVNTFSMYNYKDNFNHQTPNSTNK